LAIEEDKEMAITGICIGDTNDSGIVDQAKNKELEEKI